MKSASQLNINGVYLHILGDALGSVIVMISALIILLAHGTWTLYVDPAMSIVMVLIILKTSIPLLKETSLILMQTVPTHLNAEDIKTRLLQTIPGIQGVHEFHVWQLSGDKIIGMLYFVFQKLESFLSFKRQQNIIFANLTYDGRKVRCEFISVTFNQAYSFKNIFESETRA